MGKGRDKRKKHEDPTKQAARLAKQMAKQAKQDKKLDKKDGAIAGEGTSTALEGGLNGEESIEVTLKRLQKAEGKRKAVDEVVDCVAPKPRANAAITMNPSRETELVLFGGELWDGESTQAFNDLFVFNTTKLQWTHVKSPSPPPPRSSVQVIAYKHYLIYHGGEFVSQSQSQYLHYRDLWRFDTKTYLWEAMRESGGPSARSGHRMELWKRQAVVFAGFYDNALETRYYNDLWILSDLEGNGQWKQITFGPHAEMPAPRSGHTMGIHNDTLFVYGGYSTQKFNRFKKSEATVHHDLWSVNLTAETPKWTKIRLSGIPPPIRSGVSSCVKDKKMYLFGGVVDIDAPGGKTMSAFHNDLFVFNMETQRFFPMVLQPPKKKAGGKHADPEKAVGGGLADELGQLGLAGSSDDDEDDEEDMATFIAGSAAAMRSGFHSTTTTIHKQAVQAASKENHGVLTAAALGVATGELPKSSIETLPTGQQLPCKRMDSALCVTGHTLYVFGGQFEVGKREVTIADLFALNLNRMDGYQPLLVQDLSQCVWKGQESEASAGSWEDGSTVASFTSELDRMHDLEDEEDEEQEEDPNEPAPAASATPAGDDDDDDEIPEAIPFNVKDVDALTKQKGKKGVKQHKLQLEAQLGAGAMVPTPTLEETADEFFARTEDFWLASALESVGGDATDVQKLPASKQRKLRNEARTFMMMRFVEATELLRQLQAIEAQQAEEDAVLRELVRAKRAKRQAEAEEAAREAEEAEREEQEETE